MHKVTLITLLAAFLVLVGCDKIRGFGFADGQIRAVVMSPEVFKGANWLPEAIASANSKRTLYLSVPVELVDESWGEALPARFHGKLRYTRAMFDYYDDVSVPGDLTNKARFEVLYLIADCSRDRVYPRLTDWINSRGRLVKSVDSKHWKIDLESPDDKPSLNTVQPNSLGAVALDFACGKTQISEWEHDLDAAWSWFYRSTHGWF